MICRKIYRNDGTKEFIINDGSERIFHAIGKIKNPKYTILIDKVTDITSAMYTVYEFYKDDKLVYRDEVSGFSIHRNKLYKKVDKFFKYANELAIIHFKDCEYAILVKESMFEPEELDALSIDDFWVDIKIGKKLGKEILRELSINKHVIYNLLKKDTRNKTIEFIRNMWLITINNSTYSTFAGPEILNSYIRNKCVFYFFKEPLLQQVFMYHNWEFDSPIVRALFDEELFDSSIKEYKKLLDKLVIVRDTTIMGRKCTLVKIPNRQLYVIDREENKLYTFYHWLDHKISKAASEIVRNFNIYRLLVDDNELRERYIKEFEMELSRGIIELSLHGYDVTEIDF